MALPHTKTSGAARMAVVYITLGAITVVWTSLWYFWMNRHPPQSDGPFFWCYGFLLTGLTLIIIGLAVGRIGQSARTAEAPPDTSNRTGLAQLQGATPPAAAPGTLLPQAARATPVAPAGVVAPVAPAQPAPVVPGGFVRH
jgi:hypothetical protein